MPYNTRHPKKIDRPRPDKGGLTLRNPHSVLAVLETRPQDIIEIAIAEKTATDSWIQVMEKAKACGIRVQESSRRELTLGEGRAGSAFAAVREKESASLEALFEQAINKTNQYGIWLALDSLQDPQNVGAIFRSAAFFGIKGVVVTQDRSAALTSTVYDVASGGMEFIPFATVTNLHHAITLAKKMELWVLGTSEHAKQDYRSVKLDRSWLVVLGNEEQGIRRLTQESCDVLCKIPVEGKVTSLNVSVAAGILMAGFHK
jgi:23S rRNA (guanosine2251-2'-O)-methyltransferase